MIWCGEESSGLGRQANKPLRRASSDQTEVSRSAHNDPQLSFWDSLIVAAARSASCAFPLSVNLQATPSR